VDNPVFQGKRVSIWFQELCFFGVFESRSNGKQFEEVYDAFSRMGPEAVPYLTQKLRYLRYEPTDKVFLWIKRNRLMRPYTKGIILPSSKRAYAAVALRRMGSSAESAVPALLEAWKHDNPEVKASCVAAMASILYGKPPLGMTLSEWNALESKVIADAAREFPDAARAQGISSEITSIMAEPRVAANRSQSILSETNQTSVAAGSGR
jgi:hypothetical protein